MILISFDVKHYILYQELQVYCHQIHLKENRLLRQKIKGVALQSRSKTGAILLFFDAL